MEKGRSRSLRDSSWRLRCNDPEVRESGQVFFAQPKQAAEYFAIVFSEAWGETRALLCEFVEDAQPILRSQLGQTSVPYLP